MSDPSSKPIIDVHRLSKRYRIGVQGIGGFHTLRDALSRVLQRRKMGETNDFWALHNISFQVQRGEVLGIVGANGAGKSTLLKILSRITEPTAGEVVLRGRVASLLEVGTGFHPELTGRENIFLNGVILGMSRAEVANKLDAIIAFSGVEAFLDTPVKRYSSGMYVRLAFSVAAHLDPEVLIVDEVLSVGDAAFQAKCLGKMSEVAGAGRTVLFVSHNMQAVEQLCTTAILLSKGRLKEQGPPHAVVRSHLELSARAEDFGSKKDVSSGITLLEASVVGPGNQPAGFVENGNPVSVGISLHSEFHHRDVAVHLGVYSDRSICVFLIDSGLMGFLLELPVGHTNVQCQIPSLPLVPGRYVFNVALVRSGAALAGFPRAGAFEVRTRDQAIPVSSAGLVSVDARWSAEPQSL